MVGSVCGIKYYKSETVRGQPGLASRAWSAGCRRAWNASCHVKARDVLQDASALGEIELYPSVLIVHSKSKMPSTARSLLFRPRRRIPTPPSELRLPGLRLHSVGSRVGTPS